MLEKNLGESKMLAATLTFSVLISLLFLLVGVVVGWNAQTYLQDIKINKYHPEMFDESGNVIPDEILAVRFENGFGYESKVDDENYDSN